MQIFIKNNEKNKNRLINFSGSIPLLIGCDLARLDEFTLSLLTNDEVIDVNQDPLGVHGAPILKTVRDLWRQKDVAETDDKHTVTVNPHGAVMLRIY